ncbi:hypothetical protein ACFFWC_23370 [Plantactinospora siamensis]|uniref:SnoaL-like domain-containing protein n=1 Tax=Plantactinospora siamensis TaxID=555372 RepID=A0ABV6NVE0_9ACTN
MRQQPSDDVREFFAEFERAGNDNDIQAVIQQFAEVFLNADPNGAQPVPRAALAAALPQRKALFDSIGLLRTHLTAITETALDEHYVLVDTQWSTELRDPGALSGPLDLTSTFVLRREAGTLRIVFYLNHQDIVARIRAASSPTPEATQGR